MTTSTTATSLPNLDSLLLLGPHDIAQHLLANNLSGVSYVPDEPIYLRHPEEEAYFGQITNQVVELVSKIIVVPEPHPSDKYALTVFTDGGNFINTYCYNSKSAWTPTSARLCLADNHPLLQRAPLFPAHFSMLGTRFLRQATATLTLAQTHHIITWLLTPFGIPIEPVLTTWDQPLSVCVKRAWPTLSEPCRASMTLFIPSILATIANNLGLPTVDSLPQNCDNQFHRNILLSLLLSQLSLSGPNPTWALCGVDNDYDSEVHHLDFSNVAIPANSGVPYTSLEAYRQNLSYFRPFPQALVLNDSKPTKLRSVFQGKIEKENLKPSLSQPTLLRLFVAEVPSAPSPNSFQTWLYTRLDALQQLHTDFQMNQLSC